MWPLDYHSDKRYNHLQQKAKIYTDKARENIRMHKAALPTLLSIRVLVQNRRKERGPILVYGSQAQVVSLSSTTEVIQRGAAPLGENICQFSYDR